MIIASDAEKYSQLIEANPGITVPCSISRSITGARAAYAGQTVLLGEPGLIAAVIAEMPAVKWVQSTWAGVKPLLELGEAGYILTGVKGIFGQQMSEYVLAYILAHELEIVSRLHDQESRIWRNEPSGTLKGKKAGVMGTGSIGSHIAHVLGVFEMQVRGLSRSGEPTEYFEEIYPLDQINPFLEDLDYVISVLPETQTTHRLLNAQAFELLPRQAFLINIGRSNVVDDTALMEALNKQELSGAVLDVFDQEPLADDSPLWSVPNLLITPHVAATSHAADIVPIFVENYERFVASKRLKFVIDFDQGY
jgi:phosphoglycerate dehydrogenase-like enzyme